MCSMAQKGVEVDMVCRVWTCKVKDDETAHEVIKLRPGTLIVPDFYIGF